MSLQLPKDIENFDNIKIRHIKNGCLKFYQAKQKRPRMIFQFPTTTDSPNIFEGMVATLIYMQINYNIDKED